MTTEEYEWMFRGICIGIGITSIIGSIMVL